MRDLIVRVEGTLCLLVPVTPAGEDWIADTLRDFIAKDLMLYLDDRYLSLALPQNRNFEVPAEAQRPAFPKAAVEPVKDFVSISGVNV